MGYKCAATQPLQPCRNLLAQHQFHEVTPVTQRTHNTHSDQLLKQEQWVRCFARLKINLPSNGYCCSILINYQGRFDEVIIKVRQNSHKKLKLKRIIHIHCMKSPLLWSRLACANLLTDMLHRIMCCVSKNWLCERTRQSLCRVFIRAL